MKETPGLGARLDLFDDMEIDVIILIGGQTGESSILNLPKKKNSNSRRPSRPGRGACP